MRDDRSESSPLDQAAGTASQAAQTAGQVKKAVNQAKQGANAAQKAAHTSQAAYISVRNKAGWKGYVLRAKGKRYVLSQYGEDTAFFLQGSVETNHVKTEIEKRLRLYRMSKVWVFFWKTGIPIFRSQKPELFCSASEFGRGQTSYYGSLEFKGLTDAIKGSRAYNTCKTKETFDRRRC